MNEENDNSFRPLSISHQSKIGRFQGTLVLPFFTDLSFDSDPTVTTSDEAPASETDDPSLTSSESSFAPSLLSSESSSSSPAVDADNLNTSNVEVNNNNSQNSNNNLNNSNNNNNNNIFYSISLGLRLSLSALFATAAPSLIVATDFKTSRKIDVRRNHSNPKLPISDANFSFSDHCPLVFRELRRCFGFDEADFFVSVTSEGYISEATNSKSGSSFFFSADNRFMFKSLTARELRMLCEFLPDYYHYLSQRPSSLLSRIVALFSVSASVISSSAHFLVMANVFHLRGAPHALHVDEKYDLKGSRIGRTVGFNGAVDPRVVKKDQDFSGRILMCDPHSQRLRAILDADCYFLQRTRRIDYSLLLGICHLDDADDVVAYCTASPAEGALASDAEFEMSNRISPHCFFASKMDGSPFKTLYFLGIIDFVQSYGLLKRVESQYKKQILYDYDPDGVSVVEPNQYAKRFYDYVAQQIGWYSAEELPSTTLSDSASETPDSPVISCNNSSTDLPFSSSITTTSASSPSSLTTTSSPSITSPTSPFITTSSSTSLSSSSSTSSASFFPNSSSSSNSITSSSPTTPTSSTTTSSISNSFNQFISTLSSSNLTGSSRLSARNTIPSDELVLFSGFLEKRGDLRKSWKNRWFVLTRSCLNYYISDEKDAELLGSIPLNSFSLRIASPNRSKTHSNCFELVFSNRTYLLSAISPEIRDAWMNMIEKRLEEQTDPIPIE